MRNSDSASGLLEAQEVTLTDWENLVRAEYSEMPGLSLTEPQARRLWQLDATLAHSLLAHLVKTRFLRRTANGIFVLAK